MDELRFTAPTFIGDTIHCKLTVTELKDKGEKGGVVTYKQEIINQNDQVVATCLMRIMLAKKK